MKRFSFLLLFLALPLIAEWPYQNLVQLKKPQQGWMKTYGSTLNDYGQDGCQTVDGGYIVTGCLPYDGGAKLLLLKTDSEGQELWRQTWETGVGMSVKETFDGGYIIGGYIVNSGWIYPWIIRTDSEGDIQWQETFQETGACYCVQQTTDSGFISTGRSYKDLFLIKLDKDGQTMWERKYGQGGAIEDAGYYVIQSSDESYVVTGATPPGIWIIKTDAAGNIQWNKTYTGGAGYCIQETSDGGYIITGNPEHNLCLLKVDSEGDSLWLRAWGGNGEEKGLSVRQTSDYGYIVTGFTESYGPGEADLWLIKTDDKGFILWDRIYGFLGQDYGFSVCETSDGGFLTTGKTNSFGKGGFDVWLLKYDSLGLGWWEISPTRILSPQENRDIYTMIPKAQFTNLNPVGYALDFLCHCEIIDLIDLTLVYHDSILMTEPVSSWETFDVEFSEWVSDSGREYKATFYATSTGVDTLPSRPLSVSFYWSAITEQLHAEAPPFELLTSVGPKVTLRFSESGERSQVSVFDASGRKVDELHVPQTGGVVSWGEEHNPGVYFIVADIDGNRQAEKVILVR